MKNLRERLIGCFQTVFPHLSAEETPKVSVSSVAEWDSLVSVTLLGVLEEEFDVQLQPEDMEYLVSFELVEDYMKEKKGNEDGA